MEIPYKTCSKCHQSQPIYEFYFSKATGKHNCHCKTCCVQYRKYTEREILRRNSLDVGFKFR